MLSASWYLLRGLIENLAKLRAYHIWAGSMRPRLLLQCVVRWIVVDES